MALWLRKNENVLLHLQVHTKVFLGEMAYVSDLG